MLIARKTPMFRRHLKMPQITGFRISYSSACSTQHTTSSVTCSKELHKAMEGNGYSYGSQFSTMATPILVQAHDPSRLVVELLIGVEERRFDDAWRSFEHHLHMDGFPRKSVISKLIAGFAESGDARWLGKAYHVVEKAFMANKYELLEKEVLIYLSFMLSRSESPVYASNVLRKLVQMEAFPPLSAWSGTIGHMCQTATGAVLAAELIAEIGYIFNDNRVDPRKKSNKLLLAMKPNCHAFNIALAGCLVFGITRKAEQLIDLMPRVGVKADANSLILMSLVCEKNGRLNEIMKLRRHIDEACEIGTSHFQKFYTCLLSCHLKFRDVDAASEIVLDLIRKANKAKCSLAAAQSVLVSVRAEEFSLSPLGPDSDSSNIYKLKLHEDYAPSFDEFLKDRNFSRLESESTKLFELLSNKLSTGVELVKSERGILHPTEALYAKLVKAYLDSEKISDLASFLIKVSKEDLPASIENSTVVQVISTCVSLGMLDQAHDLLDEMRFSGVQVGSTVYSSLLKAYCESNRVGEAEALLKDAQKSGVQLNSSCYETLIQSRMHNKDSNGALHIFKEMKQSRLSRSSENEFEMLLEGCVRNDEASLMSRLLEEIKDNQRPNSMVHDWNNVIHFFCQKRLMHDAQKALNKMKALGHHPNAQTFHSLVTGYAAIGGKYVEVTDLWGEMKTLASSSSMKFDQELLDSILYCFVRGGFFLRAMEVIEKMEAEDMFIDKFKYRTLWLKYHRTLYKGKVSKVQTEAQCRKREAALRFKRWIGLS